MNQAVQKVVVRGARPTMGIWKLFKFSFFVIFFMFLILNAILISVEERNIGAGLKDLGERVFSPTTVIYDTTNNILENEGVYQQTGNFLSDIWNFFTIYLALFSSIYAIWMWLVVWSKLWLWFFVQDTSKQTLAYICAFFTIITLQLLYIAFFVEASLESIMIPIMAFVNLFRSLPYLVNPIKGFIETIREAF